MKNIRWKRGLVRLWVVLSLIQTLHLVSLYV